MWIVTNIQLQNSSNYQRIDCGSYQIYVMPNEYISENIIFPAVLFSGYITFRKTNNVYIYSGEGLSLNHRLICDIKNDDNFIKNIKGKFILIQFNTDTFNIYSDHFGIKKIFFYTNNRKFIISDNLKAITNNVATIPSSENMGVYALTYHFTGGLTAFKDIYHNQPGQCISYRNRKIEIRQYWKPETLIENNKRNVTIKDLADKLNESISRSLYNVSSKKISLSLTGGADTRNLLALFLSSGIRPHLYTYGNKHSADCKKASKIARVLGLDHSIYEICIDAEKFEKYSRKITRLHGGLASIHRSHRLMAVELESQYAEIMFLGTLGGEFIKGVSQDDYIVPSIVFENWNRSIPAIQELSKRCLDKRLKIANLNIEKIQKMLSAEPYFNGPVSTRKINALTYITAHLHDAQDINLYNAVMSHVFTPFLDIEYLELLFSSQYRFTVKEEIKNPLIKRIENPVFASLFLKHVYPSLLSFEYAGKHKPSEVLLNKYFATITKAIRTKIRKPEPPNFPIGNWMREFVVKNLPLCNDYQEIKNTFDIDVMLEEVKNGPNLPYESFWLKFTNPILMKFIMDEYK